ncbi:FAD-dependent oxidoreductase [Psychromarinibacter sp. C21-152]|uniref:FAD-dependent oxidoreductase n=1 Tax=Psychromarinibacter sediminicola TaxID=3033385 RepID=A0AAE3NW99_9RHOB|nr:FAD-dependent oxidoreductase [Psychromarinibacter sediminicola]MDF0603441.1 FAD-dependent oxidoreductase [Psychromarinibacter sediminicola]
MADRFDILVIGAGVAGLSAAAALAGSARVAVLEAEDQPGYHATGRSAAILAQNYGNGLIRALTAASLPFFDTPPEGFAAAPLLSPRGLVRIARADQRPQLEAAFRDMAADTALRWLDADAVAERIPLLRPGYAAAGFENPDAADIDVHALMQGWQRQLTAAGGTVRTCAGVQRIARVNGEWLCDTPGGPVAAPILVNAAGAWADRVADMAGVARIGLMPLRRSAATFDAPEGVDLAGFPMTVDADEAFYMKPEAGRLLASPADETPAVPGDVRPEELDIAHAIDRVQTAFAVEVRHIRASWAGLRSFVADRAPVVGFDDGARGYFWLAAQGGYGVQTAPALARFAADSILHPGAAPEIAGVPADALAPHRIRTNRTQQGGTS